MRGWLFGALERGVRFLYPGAGAGAQPEVQAAIMRFRMLPEAERGDESLWGWLLGDAGTPPYKMSKDDIAWSKHPVDGRDCENCQRFYMHVVTGTGICDKVAGVWQADWWCEEWESPAPADVYRRYQR